MAEGNNKFDFQYDSTEDNIADIMDIEHSIRVEIYERIREKERWIKEYPELIGDDAAEEPIKRRENEIEKHQALDKHVAEFFKNIAQESSILSNHDQVKECFSLLGQFIESKESDRVRKLISKVVESKGASLDNKLDNDRAGVVAALRKLKGLLVSEEQLKFSVPVCKFSTIKHTCDEITKTENFEHKKEYPERIPGSDNYYELLKLIDKV